LVLWVRFINGFQSSRWRGQCHSSREWGKGALSMKITLKRIGKDNMCPFSIGGHKRRSLCQVFIEVILKAKTLILKIETQTHRIKCKIPEIVDKHGGKEGDNEDNHEDGDDPCIAFAAPRAVLERESPLGLESFSEIRENGVGLEDERARFCRKVEEKKYYVYSIT